MATAAKMASVHHGLLPKTRYRSKGTLIELVPAQDRARLRRPAIVASVAMNGGSRSWLIISACNKSDRQAQEQGQRDRQRRSAASTEVAADVPSWSQAVNSLALTIDDSATTEPTDRSMPPAMITTAAPTDSTPNSATWCNSVWRLYAEKKARDGSSR